MSCNMFSVGPLADGRRNSGHITKPEPLQSVGLWTYGGMPKIGSTYARSGNSVEIKLAEIETGQKVILEAVSVP